MPSAPAARICALLYQRVEPFPLVSAERHDVSLYGRLFRDHDASPGYQRYRFRDRPQNQRRRALVKSVHEFRGPGYYDCRITARTFELGRQIQKLLKASLEEIGHARVACNRPIAVRL